MVKADYDSLMSYYDITVEELGQAPNDTARAKIESQRVTKRQRLDVLAKRLQDAKDALDKLDAEIRAKVTSHLEGPQKALDKAEDDLKKITGVFDRFAKASAQKKWKLSDTIRALPILDGFASPEKIQQITLSDLTIDYGGFRDVPRFDRCTTCHQGIDRGIFEKSSLEALGSVNQAQDDKLKTARELLEQRYKSCEKQGVKLGDLPAHPGTMKLTKGEITQFASHPRLDLFIDSNSPHPVERFGCTSCHGGQGSATDFPLSSHTPNDGNQEEEWKRKYGWFYSHDWEFPMQPARFMESACLKCHYQVTDLIREGNKEEAPKLLNGYNLVREN
ncbi:MAG: hypothetical protein ACRD36_14115, partial [Candidatus Acidiferrum sp.]